MNLDRLKAFTGKRLAELGSPAVVYRVLMPGDGPPWDPGPSTEVDHPCNAAPPAQFDATEVANSQSLIQTHDLRVTIAAEGLPVVPSTAGTLLIDSEVYQIVRVTPVYYGTEVGHYDLQVRR